MKAPSVYSRGRLSAPVSGPHGEHPVHQDYELIEQLRAARIQGDKAMAAVEQYDPNFSVQLSACENDTEATELLDAWLGRRVEVLKHVQAHLRRVWQAAQQHRSVARTGKQSG